MRYTRLESYPLGDYLYNRSKAHDDLVKADYRTRRFVESLPGDVRDAVERMERIFSRKKVQLNLDNPKERA